MTSLQPVPIYSMGADEEKGETARLSSFVGAIAIGDLVKSTLGPKGMDKILCSRGPSAQESVQITNDGATIMKAIGVDNPAAKVLVDISRVQDSEVGDGTTSVVVLTSELLRQAEFLVARKLHPQTIISGWRQGLEVGRRALSEAARECTEDNLRDDLQQIAETTISSKIISQHKLHFANLAVNAMQRVWNKEDPTSSLELISIVKKLGGTMLDSYLDEGFLLEKKIGVNQPKRMEDCRILIANTQMDTDKVKVFGTRVRVDSTAKVAQLELAEKQKMKEKVELILKHNINVFVNRQLIYNYPEQLFADSGVMAIEHADFEGVERLARALDGEIISTFHNPDKVKVGHCKVIEEVRIDLRTFTI
ncbi:Chaperonin complex component TCP-1 beta subunit [Oopsacas minuta]|uniref:T-complex protein 1 subunit beta n=1 Tax=Oopsacas minuta TaxID=111878 RepID=A0AAV7KK04_9METZ|nr:Chaperonin complex component TCP-1 beta subunit [Oopsacas minuta]